MREIVSRRCWKCKETKPTSEFYKKGYMCKSCARAYGDAYREKRRNDPETRKRELAGNTDRQLQRHYGITLEEYNAMLEKQNGVCAVCGKPPNGRRLHVDHDHKTGAVRGLLCSGCNTALGDVNDSMDILQRLIKYLTR